jgi:pyridoxine kinase
MKTAAKKIHALGAPNILIKGGSRLTGERAYDLLYHSGQYTVFEAEKSTRTTTNGAGCTLSSAIAALLAKGTSLETAVQTAKAFVWAGIEDGLPLGTSGNVNQLAYFKKEEHL